MVPVVATEPCARRALVLLMLFVLGCAVAAAAIAAGLGAAWQDLYAWIFPQVAGGPGAQ